MKITRYRLRIKFWQTFFTLALLIILIRLPSIVLPRNDYVPKWTQATERSSLGNQNASIAGHDVEIKVRDDLEVLLSMNVTEKQIPVKQVLRREENGITLRPWPDDPECSRFVTKFGRNMSLVYLASFPKSGSYVARQILEASLGVFTGSVYKDQRDQERGFVGESESPTSGRVFFIQTHAQTNLQNNFEQRLHLIPHDVPVILLIRKPLQAIASLWTRSKESYNMKNTRNNFHVFVQHQLLIWEEMITDRLMWSKKLHVVFFENLVEFPVDEVRRMFEFLQIEEESDRLACVQKHLQMPESLLYTQNDMAFSIKEKMTAASIMSPIVALLQEIRGVEVPLSYTEFIKSYTHLYQHTGRFRIPRPGPR